MSVSRSTASVPFGDMYMLQDAAANETAARTAGGIIFSFIYCCNDSDTAKMHRNPVTLHPGIRCRQHVRAHKDMDPYLLCEAQ